MKYIFATLIFFLLNIHSSFANAKSEIVLQTKSKDVIWGLSFINDNEIIFSERAGKIFYYNFINKKLIELKAPKVKAKGQGGMLDVYYQIINNTPFLYYTFSNEVKGVVVTSLGRAIFKNNTLTNHEVLLNTKIKSDTTRHFGSRLQFTKKYLYMTVGDRGERKYAQDLRYHNGKILRLTHNGKAAKGNPFESRNGALKEIWSYGHRNPQGIAMSSKGQLYSCEFGPRGGDELNLIKPGLNYGWPIITYGKEYWGPSIGQEKKKGMEQPLVYWTPSISPSGMLLYESKKNSKWNGNIFLAALSSRHLRRVELDNGRVVRQESLLKPLNERMRQVKASPSGNIYVTTDTGKIIIVTDL